MPTRKPTTRRPAGRVPRSAEPKAGSRRRAPLPGAVRPARGSGGGLAPGMLPINTYLAVANVTASMEFLERALGFARGVVLTDTDGQLRYAEMRHHRAVVVLVRKGDAASPSGGSAGLYAYVEDVDRVASQARLAGAGVEEPEDKPWGDRVAVVTDPDGHRWVLATFKRLAPFS